MQKNTLEIQVILTDDHVLYQRGIEDILREESTNEEHANLRTTFSIVAKCKTVDALFQSGKLAGAKLLLLDLQMPQEANTLPSFGVGLNAIKKISKEYPTLKILVVSHTDKLAFVIQALQNGAIGFLNKGEIDNNLGMHRILWDALDATAEKPVLSPALGANYSKSLNKKAPLSPRQLEILLLRLQENPIRNNEIALQLSIEIGTVEKTIQKALEKLGVKTIAEAQKVLEELGYL